MATEQCKTTVIVVGSGLTGLTLALMLQDLGVDYLLLEAHGSCTPNVGASLAIQPQGLRIFHQLGILEDVEAIYQPVGQMLSGDAETGKLHIIETTAILKERHGYEIGFFNRYDLLCVLHKHIREKERLLVNQQITHVDGLEDKAIVHTSAGHFFEAQVVIGADGVRSTVRKEMWRNAEVAGAVPEEDKKEFICDWATCFGVSEYGASLPRGQVGSVSGDGFNAAWLLGKDGRCFTFWFFKLSRKARKVTYNTIPRFTEEDYEREITRGKSLLAEVPRNNGLHIDFDQLYSQVHPAHSGITALPHFVLKKWHYGRIVVVGDSSHKFNPLPGHGGMNCLVSAATLINCLQETLGDKLKTSQVWDVANLNEAFTKLAEKRFEKVKSAVEASEEAMNMMGWSNGYKKLLYKGLVPILPNFMQANSATTVIRGGDALQGWDLPTVPHTVKYDDEEKPIEKEKSIALSPATLLLTATAIGVGGIVVMRTLQKHPELLANGRVSGCTLPRPSTYALSKGGAEHIFDLGFIVFEKQKLGPAHASISTSMAGLALMYLKQGRREELATPDRNVCITEKTVIISRSFASLRVLDENYWLSL
ncbi:monooxygenase fad-binding protein [Diaporthe amygdali]|uniref:NAD(P)/FAD-dependent oxidoreductase family protein n=1 Tax=Phomopsis amygdali TaxID=1214568 RepID=UPI0022FDBA89|nr:NAD(P)/FAD-dependent oxidoreductase family protein [Diaporthe amygdali]KAJ0103784.1 monooxygenase fad-binding protein [Diaporthe amygdali]